MSENEIWKDIKGYEGLYQVSNMGRVMGLDRIVEYVNGKIYKYKCRVLKPVIRRCYQSVLLSKNGKRTHKTIHRLVAETFIPNSNNLPQVNHKDENKLNNCVENLEWCTAKYNVHYSGTIEKAHIGAIKNKNWLKAINSTKKPVIQLTLESEFVAEYESARDAERKTGINHSNISACCVCRYKSAGGYKWMHKS